MVHTIDNYPFPEKLEANLNRILESFASRGIEKPEERQKVLETYILFKRHLIETLMDIEKSDPDKFGIPVKWTASQKELLQNLINSLKYGINNPVFGHATGQGKTHIIGAYAYAFCAAAVSVGLDPEVLVITSRISLVKQAVTKKGSNKNIVDNFKDENDVVTYSDEDDEESKDDNPFIDGDFKVWMNLLNIGPVLTLYGNQYTKKENLKHKNSFAAVVTTRQGASKNKSLKEYMNPYKIRLVWGDECHGLNDRVVETILQNFPGMFVQSSATPQGPLVRDMYKYSDAVVRAPFHKIGKIHGFNSHLFLASNYGILRAIREGLAPALRYLMVEPKVLIGNYFSSQSQGLTGITSRLTDRKVADKIYTSVDAVMNMFEQTFITGSHLEVMSVVGSALPHARQWCIFTPDVKTAKVMSKAFNAIISPMIKERFKKDFTSSWVSGVGHQTNADFVIEMERFHNNEVQMMFSCEIIGEGVDLPYVSAGMSLMIYGTEQEYNLIQRFGRIMRLFFEIVNNKLRVQDTLYVEGVFGGKEGVNLATVLGLTEVKHFVQGGILVGTEESMAYEENLFNEIRRKKELRDIEKGLDVSIKNKYKKSVEDRDSDAQEIIENILKRKSSMIDVEKKKVPENTHLQSLIANPVQVILYIVQLLTSCKYPMGLLRIPINADFLLRKLNIGIIGVKDFLKNTKLLPFHRLSDAFEVIYGKPIETLEDYKNVISMLVEYGLPQDASNNPLRGIKTDSLGIKLENPDPEKFYIAELESLVNREFGGRVEVGQNLDRSWIGEEGGYCMVSISVDTLSGISLRTYPHHGKTLVIAAEWAAREMIELLVDGSSKGTIMSRSVLFNSGIIHEAVCSLMAYGEESRIVRLENNQTSENARFIMGKRIINFEDISDVFYVYQQYKILQGYLIDRNDDGKKVGRITFPTYLREAEVENLKLSNGITIVGFKGSFQNEFLVQVFPVFVYGSSKEDAIKRNFKKYF